MIKCIKDLNADVVKLKRFFTERNLHGPETTFPKRYMERHLRYEFLFILEGTAEYAFNGTMAELQPGDGILIRPWISHQRGYPEDVPDGIHLWLGLSRNHFYATLYFLEGGRYTCQHLPRESSPELVSLLLKKEKNDSAEDSASLFALFALLLQDIVEENTKGDHDSGDRMEHIIKQVRSRIASCNGVNCSLEELSKIFGFSKSHLCHSFRKYTGQSVGEYINNLRMQYAIVAREHGMTQKEIAADLGFSSPAAFWLWKKRLSCKKR